MLDLDEVRADLTGMRGSLPFCPDYMWEGIRHLQRNCEIECPEHEDDPDAVCSGPSRDDGDRMARLLNAMPELLNRIEHLEALRLERDA